MEVAINVRLLLIPAAGSDTNLLLILEGNQGSPAQEGRKEGIAVPVAASTGFLG